MSQYKITKILKSFSSSRATPIDGLDTYSIKIAAELIKEPVHHIIRLAKMQKSFPSAWKSAKLISLHKRDEVFMAKTYRPVPILSPLSKILERVIV